MPSIYTVGQVNTYIKQMFSQDFMLANICIKGEISNVTYHSSGHIYFTLKDKTGVISAIMFKGNRNNLKFTLEEGQKVIVLGSVNVFERDGKYQLYAKSITLEGAGLLYQRFEQLKNELSEMGLFDKMYKKPIPKYSLKIGICTAKTGAAIQDIINITKRRNPYVQLYLYSSLVQGAEAAIDIVNGIRYLDSLSLDVIIVGRGGGSIEDLWAFNEEIVAKAIFDCNTPIISAVGHETDTTIADYVADLRAPTPSAAAEIAVFDYNEYLLNITRYKQLLLSQMVNKISNTRNNLKYIQTKLNLYNPINQLNTKKQYSDELYTRLNDAFNSLFTNRKHMLAIYAEKLNGLSPLNKISKGFAYFTNDKGEAINSVKQVNVGDDVMLTVKDGQIKAKTYDITEGVYNGK
ncbi:MULTISPECIES: exodeoxyribonuclease VII large subunit [unclassified Eubacterium (in: firmicutes)]|uniref:exodeoxyribonuclease VII large subunit n=3 Tax=Eubacterium TaxID=1730 RepID=UPI000E545024|nr:MULTISPECIES: exodeoxyribonuclease VII large subunit [unclassified Eubacterium (in: firmicutes)]RGF50958.1 exodeoxyribonuclease VII large subunit [Eubacterium sp. AF36-5BH]RHP21689.1 exodeoxyribonuclease VII large subunit [Eubacterium sp. AF34-35BH]